MRPIYAVLLAAALAAGATPAAACGFFRCFDEAVSDDNYPPGEPTLPPNLQAQVRAREDGGLSLAGFYNDPDVAAPVYGYEPRVVGGYGAPAPSWSYGSEPGPRVIMSPYGRRYAHRGDERRVRRD